MNRLELRQDLRVALKQRLVLCPTVQQSLELLQLSSVELEKLIDQELCENPLLEIQQDDAGQESTSAADDPPSGDGAEEPSQPEPAVADDEDPEPKRDDEKEDHLEFLAEFEDFSHSQGYQGSPSEEPWRPELVEAETLSEHLLAQVYDMRLAAGLEEAVRYVIYSLDRHGLLSMGMEDLESGWEGDRDLLHGGLELVRSLEPTGIGSFSARDALLTQLVRNGVSKESLEFRLIDEFFDELPGHQYPRLAKSLGVTAHEVQEAIGRILELDPYPGSYFAPGSNTVVIPDIFITLVEGRYMAILNESRFPTIVISERNRRVLESPDSHPEEKRYVREKYSKASHFLRSIEERQQTVRRIAEFLADFQNGFFDNGVKYLLPLTLQQVADSLGYSQSTISRAINGKYVESPQGIHELRFYFSRRLAGSEDISTRTAKEELRRIVEEEDPGNPHSDEILVNLLRARGLSVKRRTVANYRTQLNIPPARQRKRF